MKGRLGIFLFLWLIVGITLMPIVFAEEKYSFEKAEELKPLIEWRDYGPEGFNEAVNDNKPLFVLLTAPSWCYWCQVYESEDYLFNEKIYPFLNDNYIPIYIDADKRQDLTRQYLEGGWPSTTVMAPNKERLFGYSGPRPVDNMLINLKSAAAHVKQQGYSNEIKYEYNELPEIIPNEDQLRSFELNYANHFISVYDSEFGGFGSGQKFPQGRTLDYALDEYEKTGNTRFLEIVQNTLKNQYTEISELETNYNLFDPVEGGFHRYGTSRDWTPPHYEKMLYDNVRLLKTYNHLLDMDSKNELALEVVQKTEEYVVSDYFDSVNGGFFGNTDVNGEHEYYAKNPRPLPKARVEKTKYTDWNSEAILTFLYLWEKTGDEKYKKISKNSLDFYLDNMISENGAYHYFDESGEKGVTGNILDNSYLLLAFVEGYEIFEEEKYLIGAEKIAGYSLEYLYDWNSGGFFERNSKETNIYALGDNVLLTKPSQENGVMAFAMLKLYNSTNNATYLGAGIKTTGYVLGTSSGLDRAYYSAKSAQYILNNNLLNVYEKNSQEINKIKNDVLEEFWLNELTKEIDLSVLENDKFEYSSEGTEGLNGSIIVLLFISFIAGLLSFVSPCTLPILPAYVSYNMNATKKNVLGMNVYFFSGFLLMFVIIGVIANYVGSALKNTINVFTEITGVLLIVFGILVVFGIGLPGINVKQKKPVSYFGSFFLGLTLAAAWTPCVGPILASIIILASVSSSAISGGLLLLLYGLGLSLPLIVFTIIFKNNISKKGFFYKFIRGKNFSLNLFGKKLNIHSSSLISGIILILLGYLIFSGLLFKFSEFALSSNFQTIIFNIEEWLLGLTK